MPLLTLIKESKLKTAEFASSISSGSKTLWSNNLLKLCRPKIMFSAFLCFNPIALRKAKIAYNFDLSECNRVKDKSSAESR